MKLYIFGPFNAGLFYTGPYYAACPKITPIRAGVKRADKVLRNFPVFQFLEGHFCPTLVGTHLIYDLIAITTFFLRKYQAIWKSMWPIYWSNFIVDNWYREEMYRVTVKKCVKHLKSISKLINQMIALNLQRVRYCSVNRPSKIWRMFWSVRACAFGFIFI